MLSRLLYDKAEGGRELNSISDIFYFQCIGTCWVDRCNEFSTSEFGNKLIQKQSNWNKVTKEMLVQFDYQATRESSSISLKWLSLVAKARSFWMAIAAIQMSFSGMGFPFFLRPVLMAP